MSEGETAEKPELKVVESAPEQQTAPLLEEGNSTNPAQGEMPFAVVEGEAVTELPRDLYIPPQALEVFLEAFEGPLDLLLYLIRRIKRLTRQPTCSNKRRTMRLRPSLTVTRQVRLVPLPSLMANASNLATPSSS